jgi:tellurite resistance protein TerC
MDFLYPLINTQLAGTPLWMWGSFMALVFALLAFDMGVLTKNTKEIGVKQSLWLSAFYISLGLLFGIVVFYELGATAASQYYTGFVVEKSLSLDNIFVMAIIFGYFKIPREYQHRVLVYGILGVIVLRGLLIGLGATIVSQFEFVLWFFAAFLVYTGIKMLGHDEDDMYNADNKILAFLRKYLPVTDKFHGNHFFAKLPPSETGLAKAKTFVTPLFIALIMVEIADVIFAVDSIPAIFSITTDPYVVFTSNLFAILGLRALFFALSAMLERFSHLKYALSLVLVFIGGKVLVDVLGEKVLDMNLHLDSTVSLIITLGILSSGVIYSLYKTRGGAKVEDAPAAE